MTDHALKKIPCEGLRTFSFLRHTEFWKAIIWRKAALEVVRKYLCVSGNERFSDEDFETPCSLMD